MIRAAAAIVAATAAAASADVPAPIDLPEQPPAHGPRTVRLQLDTGLVTGNRDVEARNLTTVVDLRMRLGSWMVGAQAGVQRWSDHAYGIGARHMRGLSATNPSLSVTYWARARRIAPVQLGFHAAMMWPAARGVEREFDSGFISGYYEPSKSPSQMTRLGAMPYDHPSIGTFKLGGFVRADRGRWLGQTGLAADWFWSGSYPNEKIRHRWIAIAGAGFRITPSLVVLGHALGTRTRDNYTREDELVVGLGLRETVGPGQLGVRAERRVDDCYLGELAPRLANTGACTRVTADYTLPF